MSDFEDVKETGTDEQLEDIVTSLEEWKKANGIVRNRDLITVRNFLTFYMKQLGIQPGPHNEELMKKIFN